METKQGSNVPYTTLQKFGYTYNFVSFAFFSLFFTTEIVITQYAGVQQTCVKQVQANLST